MLEQLYRFMNINYSLEYIMDIKNYDNKTSLLDLNKTEIYILYMYILSDMQVVYKFLCFKLKLLYTYIYFYIIFHFL